MAKRVDNDGGRATTEVRTSTGRDQKLEQLRRRRQEVLDGGPRAAAGGPAVRARLAALLDEGSFVELDMFATSRAADFGMDEIRVAGDGAVAGFGTIEGREVAVYAIDASVLQGAIGEVTAEKIGKLQELALRSRIPLVAIDGATGPRLAEGLAGLAGRTQLLAQKARASGVIPQMSVLTAPPAGSDGLGPALADLTFEVGRGSGAGPHFRFPDEASCWAGVRQVLSYLPANSAESPPSLPPADDVERADPELQELIPEGAGAAYDVREVIGRVLDRGTFLEAGASEAEHVVVGFGRLGGHPVGVVANQPQVRDGVLDGPAALKAGRFVRTCDAFNLPLVALVDAPEPARESGAGAREVAALLAAYAEATVPKLTVVLRRWYGGAYSLLGAKELGADLNLAWPLAEIAVTAPEVAVDDLYRAELSEEGGERRASLAAEYRATVADPYVVAERGHIDDVIEPRETRRELIRGLELCRRKQVELPARKHTSAPV